MPDFLLKCCKKKKKPEAQEGGLKKNPPPAFCLGMEVQIYSLAVEDIAEEFENAAGEYHT